MLGFYQAGETEDVYYATERGVVIKRCMNADWGLKASGGDGHQRGVRGEKIEIGWGKGRLVRVMRLLVSMYLPL